MDGGVAEKSKEGGVGVDGDGAEVVGEVAVENITAGDAPREVEFAGEVDESIRPGEPGGVEHEGREGGVEEHLRRKDKDRRGGTGNFSEKLHQRALTAGPKDAEKRRSKPFSRQGRFSR